MKIIVLSDTHGNYPLAIRGVEQVGDVDCIIHLGDEMADASIIEAIGGAPVIKVPGNCDLQNMEPRELQKTLAGKRFFITHGDWYCVKAGLSRLHRKALTESAQVVLYGHTHVASIEIIDGIYFINPGCMSKGQTSGSYAVIKIRSGTITANIHTVKA